MELKTVKQIEKINELNSFGKQYILLRITELLAELRDEFDDICLLEEYIDEILSKRKNEDHDYFPKELLSAIGFETDDEVADELIEKYFDSDADDRMTILKKRIN